MDERSDGCGDGQESHTATDLGEAATDAVDPVRRRTLQVVGGALGAAATGTFLGACSRERDPERVTPIPLEDVPVGERTKVRHQGWPVELVRSDQEVRARLLVCTHEYCELFWYAKDSVYHCPCHGARYDPAGRPMSGPISTAMETLEAIVVGNEIHIRG